MQVRGREVKDTQQAKLLGARRGEEGGGAGIWGRARRAEDLPGESGGVGNALLRWGLLPPVAVYWALPGVDRARREALEAQAAGAAPRCFNSTAASGGQHTSSDVSDMPWVCSQFCVAAVSQKLLPYNINGS